MGDARKTYRKSLGLFELVSLGLGGTIGSGIFIVPGIAAGIAGPSSIIAWIFVSISASCVMYSLAKTSYKYPSTGAFYSIFSKVFGKKSSISLVILYLISAIFGVATIAAGIGQYVSYFGFYHNNNTVLILFIELLVIVAFCLINIKGVFLSGKAENVLTIFKVAPLVILAALLLPYIREQNFHPFYPSSSTDFLKALVIVYWPITGFEISAIAPEETKGGEKTVYRSLKIVMVIVVFVYVFLNISLIGSVGSTLLASSPAPLATASALISKESQSITAIIAIIAMLSAINAYVIAASRVLQNISYQFNLRLLGEISASGTPKVATIVVTFAAFILLFFFSSHFEQLAIISVIATLLPYVFVCLSAYKIFLDDNKTKVIAGIGLLSTFAIFTIYFILYALTGLHSS